MKNLFAKILFIPLIFLAQVIFLLPVSSQTGFCDLFPCGPDNSQVPVIDNPNATANSLLITVVSLFFTGFIAFGVLVIIKGALKIITAQAADEKVEEGYKAIRAVFIGLGLTFVGIAGIAIVVSLLGGGGLFSTTVESPEGIQNIPLTN
jgi:hypothetical protein